jgi:hypothetical protein
VTVAHDDSKGHAIRRGPYSLEPLVSHEFTWRSVDSRGYRCLPISQVGEWHPWSTWCILKGTSCKRNTRWRVAPLEHVVHPEGHVAQQKQTRRVAPLEHVVRPEGHVALMMMMMRQPR